MCEFLSDLDTLHLLIYYCRIFRIILCQTAGIVLAQGSLVTYCNFRESLIEITFLSITYHDCFSSRNPPPTGMSYFGDTYSESHTVHSRYSCAVDTVNRKMYAKVTAHSHTHTRARLTALCPGLLLLLLGRSLSSNRRCYDSHFVSVNGVFWFCSEMFGTIGYLCHRNRMIVWGPALVP